MIRQDIRHVPGPATILCTICAVDESSAMPIRSKPLFRLSPNTVLEVGIGRGIVTAALRAAGLKVRTLDVQPALKPDIVASVIGIPCEKGVFDVALCSQVLEHLPFDHFAPALRELRRVVRQGLVLSLPDASRHWHVSAKLPKIPEFRLGVSLRQRIPMPDSRKEHYWEIGFAGYSLRRIRDEIIAAGWTIERTWRVPELKWHRFFRLEGL